MAASLGSLLVNLQLESAQFMAGMRNAASQANTTGKAINSAMGMAKGAIGGLVGVLSVDFLSAQIGQAFDYADAIQDLADRTGSSTKFIQEFRYAAQLAGSSVESADAGLEKFAKTMGQAEGKNKAAMDTLAKYGVTSHDVDEAVRQAADTISKYENKTQQAAATAELFGKKNQNLTATMAGGRDGLSEMAEKAEELGIILDKDVIANAGQVNDKLDTMRMILTAQLAGTIVQNADALVALANGFMAAATAAANFFNQMNVKRLASVANGVGMNSDLGVLLQGRLQGKSIEQTQADALKELKTTSGGRSNRYKFLADSYNSEIRKGMDKNLPFMQAMIAEREDILKQEVASRHGMRLPPPPKGSLPTSSNKAKPSHHSAAEKLLTDDEITARWRQAYYPSEDRRMAAEARLLNDPSVSYQNDRQKMSNDYMENIGRINADAGTDDEVRKGKKRYNEAQAAILRQSEKEIFDNNYDASMREEREELRKNALEIAQTDLHNQIDLLEGERDHAKTQAERRRIGLAIVDKQFEEERNQLQSVIASELASKTDKEIARRKLAILDALKGNAQDQVKEQTQGPLESYLKAIPKTADEINEQMESVQVDGIEALQNGLMGVVHGTETVAGAFKSMVSTILDGLIKIAIQQTIIKPLATALFGGSEEGGGGGGLLGGILKSAATSIAKGSVKGARANGGYTSAGNYLVGERGPEIVQIGSNANVISNRGIRGVAGANDNAGPSIHIGNITSNDPEMVRRMVAEGVMQATPMIAKQATDRTMAKLQRRNI